ncbi:MAG TPA: aminoacyl-tRNA hydrolase [Bacteroidetes bacterium]|nr:aminoacyl-tRNA hydrolase [Bacteroidota bacterium]
MNSVVRISDSLEIPLSELRFRTSRSGGPGGQNVNKLETRVELLFDVARSPSLTEEQREMLLANLQTRIDSAGMLRVVAQEARSQWKNKQEAIEKFTTLLERALRPRKKRVATKPSASSRKKRSLSKTIRSRTKRSRGRVSSLEE